MNVAPSFVVYKSPAHEYVMLVGVQFNIESFLPDFFTADILQVCNVIFSIPPSDSDFDTEWQRMIDDLNVIYS